MGAGLGRWPTASLQASRAALTAELLGGGGLGSVEPGLELGEPSARPSAAAASPVHRLVRAEAHNTGDAAQRSVHRRQPLGGGGQCRPFDPASIPGRTPRAGGRRGGPGPAPLPRPAVTIGRSPADDGDDPTPGAPPWGLPPVKVWGARFPHQSRSPDPQERVRTDRTGQAEVPGPRPPATSRSTPPAAAASSVGASAMTRTTGSVPDGRSRTRPRGPDRHRPGRSRRRVGRPRRASRRRPRRCEAPAGSTARHRPDGDLAAQHAPRTAGRPAPPPTAGRPRSWPRSPNTQVARLLAPRLRSPSAMAASTWRSPTFGLDHP